MYIGIWNGKWLWIQVWFEFDKGWSLVSNPELMHWNIQWNKNNKRLIHVLLTYFIQFSQYKQHPNNLHWPLSAVSMG